MSLEPGQCLGPYKIVSHIGAGGMGEVWKATDTRLERQVAIKVLPSGFAANDTFAITPDRERFIVVQDLSEKKHREIAVIENWVEFLK
jgi:serine/threonine protein kinase